MSLPAVLLMAFTMAFVLLLLSEYVLGEINPRNTIVRVNPARAPGSETVHETWEQFVEREEREERLSFRQGRRMAWGLAALYAAVAFWNLGDTAAPTLAYTPAGGESAVIELPVGTELGSLMVFSGTRTGRWQVEVSEDGSNYLPLLTLDQNYVAVLKWNRATPELPEPARFLRLTSADGEPDLGELALFGLAGERITPVATSPGAEALFDEPGLVPDGQTCLNSSIFDEIYHVRTAREGLLGDTMYEITHPPLGKQILSLGMLIFGVTPFGWRFMGTLAGVLMLPALYELLFLLTRRRRLAICGVLVFAFDFMHFTQTRLATIDSYSVLFTLLAYLYMYRFYREEEHPLRALGLCGLFFGLGAATKWTGLYAGAGLAVLWLLYWLQSGRFLKKEFWKNVLWCLLFFVAVPAIIYYLSYWPYGRAAGLRFPGMWFSRDYLRIVLDNQRYMFSYHSNLVAEHPYASRWWQWLLDLRPILYYLNYPAEGTKQAIAAFTNPVLCWGGLVALLASFTQPQFFRDRRVQFLWVGFLAALVPWMGVSRLTFAYHYFTAELFLLCALALFWEEMEDTRREHWHAPATAALSGVLFALFYPVLSGAAVSTAFCERVLHWLSSWPV